jgi:hypothetical protein
MLAGLFMLTALVPAQAAEFEWPSSWRVECKDQDQTRIERLLREHVLPDLRKLLELNPAVFGPILERGSSRTVILKCEAPQAGAAADCKQGIFRKRIRLGQAWNGGWIDSAAANIVLHEILHAVGLDNFPVATHKSDQARLEKGSDGIVFHDKDLVYACSATVDPGHIQEIYAEGRSFSSCIIPDSYESCVSCLSARLDAKGKPYVPPRSESTKEQDTCAEMQRDFRVRTTLEIEELVQRGQLVLHPEGC